MRGRFRKSVGCDRGWRGSSSKILLQVQGENILVSLGFKESRIQQSTKPIGSAIPRHAPPLEEWDHCLVLSVFSLLQHLVLLLTWSDLSQEHMLMLQVSWQGTIEWSSQVSLSLNHCRVLHRMLSLALGEGTCVAPLVITMYFGRHGWNFVKRVFIIFCY